MRVDSHDSPIINDKKESTKNKKFKPIENFEVMKAKIIEVFI